MRQKYAGKSNGALAFVKPTLSPHSAHAFNPGPPCLPTQAMQGSLPTQPTQGRPLLPPQRALTCTPRVTSTAMCGACLGKRLMPLLQG